MEWGLIGLRYIKMSTNSEEWVSRSKTPRIHSVTDELINSGTSKTSTKSWLVTKNVTAIKYIYVSTKHNGLYSFAADTYILLIRGPKWTIKISKVYGTEIELFHMKFIPYKINTCLNLIRDCSSQFCQIGHSCLKVVFSTFLASSKAWNRT